MSVSVLEPGLLTTVQDAGRFGQRHLGVGCAGALDRFSHALANLLAGNADDAATLEITLTGPTLRFEQGARIALAGASLEAACGSHALPMHRAIDLPAGSELRLGACRRGARAYLAVRGGFTLDPVLGSRATDLRAGFGGIDGRALRRGDVLPCVAPTEPVAQLRVAAAWADPAPSLDLQHEALAHVLPARDATQPADALFAIDWRVAAASDRQALRLDGAKLALAAARECVSEPLVPGTIQLPPDGQPLILLGDAQTVGGYPCIGVVASADLPRLAQCRPGERLHLRSIDAVAAAERLRAQRRHLVRIGIALGLR